MCMAHGPTDGPQFADLLQKVTCCAMDSLQWQHLAVGKWLFGKSRVLRKQNAALQPSAAMVGAHCCCLIDSSCTV